MEKDKRELNEEDLEEVKGGTGNKIIVYACDQKCGSTSTKKGGTCLKCKKGIYIDEIVL